MIGEPAADVFAVILETDQIVGAAPSGATLRAR
jgi:hypothetical protein